MISVTAYVFSLLQMAAVFGSDSIAYPQDYFRAPLSIPLYLAGNFGEPRGTHFHTGLDFKTDGQEGLNVYAAADGYICRINVSPYGYGNALYVRHPNGWVTVYGHLKSFAPKIMERLRREQYAKQSFAVDFSLSSSELPVKKGDVIALSGNTGGSGGPHLHFEIRDIFDNVYNPMLFSFPIADAVKPEVTELRLYAMDSLKGISNDYRLKLYNKGDYHEPLHPAITVNAAKVGFSVNTLDRMSGSANTLGIYNMTVFDNDKMIYEYRQDKLSFRVTRNVLSQIDYAAAKTEGIKYLHKCFVDPGNDCPIYSNLADRGIVDLSDGAPHRLLIEIHDFAGNTSLVKFSLQQSYAAMAFRKEHVPFVEKMAYDKDHKFAQPGIQLDFPKGCFFDDVLFDYGVDSLTPPTLFSDIHQVGGLTTPVNKSYRITIKTKHLPQEWTAKALIVYREKKEHFRSKGGEWNNGFVSTSVREFGQFAVMVDTVPPKITPLNISPNKNMHGVSKILLRIGDDLSGIARYDTYIDGKWVVTDFDGKSATLTHYFAKDLSPGTHQFKLTVSDGKGNQANYSVAFVR